MTNRFDEMARGLLTNRYKTYGDQLTAVSTALRAVDAEAEKRGSKAGQEAMREKAKGYVEGLYAEQPEPLASAGLRFTIMCGIEALPIEEPTP